MRQQFEENSKEIHEPLKESARKHEAFGRAQAEAIESTLKKSVASRKIHSPQSATRSVWPSLVGAIRVMAAGLVAYLVTAIASWAFSLLPTVPGLPGEISLLVALLWSAVGAFIGGLTIGRLFPRHARWGILVMYVPFFAYRLMPEYARIFQDVDNPRFFWAPFATTLFVTIAMPAAQLIGAHLTNRKRRGGRGNQARLAVSGDGGRQDVEESTTITQKAGLAITVNAVS